MKKNEGVVLLPRRRDAALATPYTKNEAKKLKNEDVNERLKKIFSTPLSNKRFIG
ncbi:hypothetical protein [Pantoea agglomerans]|uniref:hypothetical protein n=1 Tax=Enterobacter agglomerans TaxID=549 RepID=UPI00301645B8